MPDDLPMLLFDLSGGIDLPADREGDGLAYSERPTEDDDSPRSAPFTRPGPRFAALLRNLNAEAEGISPFAGDKISVTTALLCHCPYSHSSGGDAARSSSVGKEPIKLATF
jgi:hypothetical protein